MPSIHLSGFDYLKYFVFIILVYRSKFSPEAADLGSVDTIINIDVTLVPTMNSTTKQTEPGSEKINETRQDNIP